MKRRDFLKLGALLPALGALLPALGLAWPKAKSGPTVSVGGEVIPVKPNSVKFTEGRGERLVTAREELPGFIRCHPPGFLVFNETTHRFLLEGRDYIIDAPRPASFGDQGITFTRGWPIRSIWFARHVRGNLLVVNQAVNGPAYATRVYIGEGSAMPRRTAL